MNLAFFVPGKPIGYDRGAARHGYTPADVAQWRRDIQACYLLAAGPGSKFPKGGEYTGPLTMRLRAHGTSADVDNVAKEAMDALKGVAYRDDSQLLELVVRVPDRILSAAGKPRNKTFGENAQGLHVEVVFHGIEVA